MGSDLSSFKKRGEGIAESISGLEKVSLRFSIFRGLTFTVFAACLASGYFAGLNYVYIAAGLFLALFIVLCVMHAMTIKTLGFMKDLKVVNERYINRINGISEGVYDGDEYYVKNHDYCQDLSIVGKKSVYALFNCAETFAGRKRFADKLLFSHNSGASVEEIKSVQEAVKDISSNPEFMQNFQAIALGAPLDTEAGDIAKLLAPGKSRSVTDRIVYFLLPLLWIIPLVFVFVNLTYAKTAALGVLAVNLIVWGIGIFTGKNVLPSGVTIRKIKMIRKLYTVLEEEDFKAAYLKDLILCGSEDGSLMSAKLSGLCHILSIADLRSQPLFALIINLVFPLDYLTNDLLLKWKGENETRYDIMLDNLGEIECLISMAQVTFTSEQYAYPEFVESDDPAENAFFDGDTICHPLLDPSTRVSNSIKLDSEIALITGSNMSGKTTMIRTVGICSILAYMGAPVPAKSLKLGRMRIMSSMRIVDSIEENMSTFKAELVRIAGIVDAGREERPLMFLIDEIFRGTNSDDRTEGALTVLSDLSAPYICGMMTTHDYALVDRTEEKKGNIVYFHFSEKYTDTDITFDYKLAEGVSRVSNAAFLMKLVGIDKGGE